MQVEGCHDYPNDYHVPSLEECGVNGLCQPGECRRSRKRLVAGDLSIQSEQKVGCCQPSPLPTKFPP